MSKEITAAGSRAPPAHSEIPLDLLLTEPERSHQKSSASVAES